MDLTRNKETDINIFKQKSDLFFETFKISKYQTPEEAMKFILALDGLVEYFLDEFDAKGITYTDEFILQLGSAFGEAMVLLFGGAWEYVPLYERWTVKCVMPDEDIVHVNVYYKMEKRFANGEEDSITYLFNSIRASYLKGVKK